ncbi:MAG: cation-translocating P-type ATPase [Gemmatimonadota bacterium]
MSTGQRQELRSGFTGPEAAEISFYLRTTTVVLVGLVVGALLRWLPAEPSPWRWVPFGIAYLAGGYRIVVDSWRALRRGRFSIDFLMGAAAVGAAIVDSPFEGTVLIFLFSLSNLLESYAMGRTRDAISRLVDLRPQEATLLEDDGRERRVPVEALTPGQVILVRPGERVSADGLVQSGRSDVDQAAITGESMPVPKAPGDDVFAGTINQGGALVVTVGRPASETMLSRIIRLVEEAREERAPAQLFIDRFAHPYTLGVVLATILVAAVPPLAFGTVWSHSFYRAMTLLVVASPCALVISTPSAILSGIANAARYGILFKGGAFLDLAGTIDTVAFDKTGTLTEGRPQLQVMITRAELIEEHFGPDAAWRAPAMLMDEDRMLACAAAIEQTSEHHIARAITEAAQARGLELPAMDAFTSFPGEGASADVDGYGTWVGNLSMAERMGARLSPLILGWSAEQTQLGRSVVYVGTEDELQGAMALADVLKPTAAATIRHLKYEGIRWVTLLSGDHPEAVRAVAAELGVDEVRAGLLPHQKVDTVRALVSTSRGVGMVGDGVNDAPALAAATLGIAMGAMGTDVAIETADVVLMSDDPEKVDYVIHLGKRTRRVVRQNVWFSVGWMAFLVATTLTVGIPLPLAVVAHEGSTLLVAMNGLRLLNGRPHPPTVPVMRRARDHVSVPTSSPTPG